MTGRATGFWVVIHVGVTWAARLDREDAMDTIPPPETFVTDAARVFCDGDEHGGDYFPHF